MSCRRLGCVHFPMPLEIQKAYWRICKTWLRASEAEHIRPKNENSRYYQRFSLFLYKNFIKPPGLGLTVAAFLRKQVLALRPCNGVLPALLAVLSSYINPAKFQLGILDCLVWQTGVAWRSKISGHSGDDGSSQAWNCLSMVLYPLKRYHSQD